MASDNTDDDDAVLRRLAHTVVWQPGALWYLIERAPHDEGALVILREFCHSRDAVLRRYRLRSVRSSPAHRGRT